MMKERAGGSPALLFLVTILALFLRIYGMWSQPPTADDQMVLLSAVNYLESGQLGPTMWNHPALRNILAYGMLKLFGSGVVGTVGLNIALGTLCTPLLYLVARRLTGSVRVALVAALIWGVEPLAVEYSRQAINDIYLAFFPLLGILALLRYLDRYRTSWLVLAGIAFGLGLASKWSVVLQLGVVAALLCYRLVRAGLPRGALAARLLLASSCLAVLPFTIYLATFLPWFGRGYSISEWPALQWSMYRETKLHTGYKKEIYGDHQAWQWFVRPGISHEDYIFTLNDNDAADLNPKNTLRVLIAMANPLVWLAVIPAFCVVVRRAWRERSEGLTVLAALLFFSYAPMAAAPRPIWFNTGVVVLPYVAIVVAYAICRVREGGHGRARLAAGYLGAICLVSLLLYPLAIGEGFHLPVVGDYLLTKEMNRQGVSKDIYQEK